MQIFEFAFRVNLFIENVSNVDVQIDWWWIVWTYQGKLWKQWRISENGDTNFQNIFYFEMID